jgi:hypothetical protein
MSTRLVGILRWGKTVSLRKVVRTVVFSRQQLYCLSAAALFGSAPPPARWGNSVLNAALCPRDQLWDPPPALLWEDGLLPQPHSQTLCFSWVLLGAGSSSGKLVFCPVPALSLWCFTGTESLAPCPTPVLWGRFSILPPPLLSTVDYSLLFMFFSFAMGLQSALGLCQISFLGGG